MNEHSSKLICSACKKTVRPTDAFCSHCGTPRGAAKKQIKTFTPALQTPEGRRVYAQILQEKKNKNRWTLLFIFLNLAVGALLYFNGLFSTHMLAWLTPLIILFLLLGVFAHIGSWHHKDYLRIPGSTDDKGEHRCIHCGHKGIYRSTIYKTNTTLANCASCRKHLWQE